MNEMLIKLLTNNPDTIAEIVKTYIEKYKPMVYSILHDCFDIWKDYVNNDEVYAVDAKHYRKLLEAFMNEGFTREEAMLLIIKKQLDAEKAANKISTNTSKIK